MSVISRSEEIVVIFEIFCFMKYLLIVVLVGLFFGCKKKINIVFLVVVLQLEVVVNLVFGVQLFYIDSSYIFFDGLCIWFKEIKFYFMKVGNGGNQLIDVVLFDYYGIGYVFIVVFGEVGNFVLFIVMVGMDSVINYSDLVVYLNNSCLNIINVGDMYWNWNVGYIFLKIEVMVDIIFDGIDNFDYVIVWYFGIDLNCFLVLFLVVNWVVFGFNLQWVILWFDMKNVIENLWNMIDIKIEFMIYSGMLDMLFV